VDTNAAGTVRGTQTVTVAAAPAATGSLSRTGFDPTGLLVGGGLLLLARRRGSCCGQASQVLTGRSLIETPPNDRPGSLRTGARTLAFSRAFQALTLSVGLLALAGCSSDPGIARPSPTPSVSPSDPAAYAAQIVQGTNEVRRAKGLPTLGGSRCAQDAAQKRAKALIGKAELTHALLNGVIAGCASGTTAAENLSKAAATPAAVIDAWMHSPGHRSNLLDPALTQIGVGCVMGGQSMLCSQVFLGP